MKKRILVIGCSGSGKSTFSKKLSKITNIPVCHLDKLWWKAGWVHDSRENFDRKLEKVLAHESFIIDGNYNRTLEKRLETADVVYRFKLGRTTCIIGFLKRMISGKLGKKRSDITEGCKEFLDPEMIKFIWNFNKTNEKECNELLKKFPHLKIVEFSSRVQADKYLKGLKQT